MPRTSMRCERCGALTRLPMAASSRFSRVCSTCRGEAERELERARVAEEEGIALTELATADLDVAMLKEGK